MTLIIQLYKVCLDYSRTAFVNQCIQIILNDEPPIYNALFYDNCLPRKQNTVMGASKVQTLYTIEHFI